MAAAKDCIEGHAGDHHRYKDDNDGLQRHSVLLPSSIPSRLVREGCRCYVPFPVAVNCVKALTRKLVSFGISARRFPQILNPLSIPDKSKRKLNAGSKSALQ